MMLVAVLLGLLYAIYAQYPTENLPQNPPQSGSPLPYGISPPNYYPPPPVVYEPVWLPEYPASHELLYPRRDNSRDSSSSSGSDCDQCRRVMLSCRNSRYSGCFKPKIRYQRSQCNEAIVSCNSYGENVLLVTNNGDVLSDGLGLAKFIKCKRGKWISNDIYGDRVSFKGLRCLRKAPRV